MSSQDIVIGAHAAHVRELKAEIARLREENTRIRGECESLLAHFDQALLAAGDLRSLPPGGRLEIWDGWNLILGAEKEARDRGDLVAQARRTVEESGGKTRVWIILDGSKEASSADGGVRVSYTGGAGPQRADRMITDYVRMAAWLGRGDMVTVRTRDKDLARQTARLAKAQDAGRSIMHGRGEGA